MNKNIIIWYDFGNVPHVHFFKPIIKYLESNGYLSIFSLRDFLETEELFNNEICRNYQKIGKHFGKNKIMKVIGIFSRTIELMSQIKDFDVKITIGGDSSEYTTFLKRRKSITFDDNELAPNWRYAPFPNFYFWPDAVPKEIIYKQGFKKERLYRYGGFKEDIYVADYQPNRDNLKKIPFDNYVLLRSENIKANYVPNKTFYIFPEILELLVKGGYNVVVLPRNQIDYSFAKEHQNVFVVEKAVNGLDACYFADAVITGAGTLAREAACLGVPAFSFFAGKQLLAVDKSMIERSMLYHSRDAKDIVEKVNKSNKHTPDLTRSKNVQKEVFDKLTEVLATIKG